MEKLRIATRESALALWQANHVKALLETRHSGLVCEIIGITTEGDRNKVSPLSQMGGKGVFVKELETALFNRVFNKLEFISALVKINDNIVAKLGAIIPEPFAIPQILISSSPTMISS